MSPEKNPCRVKDASSSWYRYDPYMSKVMPSPMKTQLISPVKSAIGGGPAPLAPIGHDEVLPESGLHRNSLFNAPTPVTPVAQQQPMLQQYQAQPQVTQQKPVSFLAAVEKQKPAFAALHKAKQTESASGKTHFAVVHFKHDSATFIAPFRIVAGDHVIVEGDRGVDIGQVADITNVTPAYPVPLKIVRRATSKDMEAFQHKVRKEQVVSQQVQALAESLSLGVQIVDTEFQFDNNKLTVFFEGRKQIDFRKLQRSLFREHRCRIWLSNMGEIEYNAKLQKVRRTR
eukprot:95360_1